jgi:hypothetical protein
MNSFCLSFIDVDVTKPDEKSIMTYIAQFSRRFPDLVRVCVFVHLKICLKNSLFRSFFQPFGSINKEHGELLLWLADTRQRLTHVIQAPAIDIQAEYKVTTHSLCVMFVFIIHKEKN